MKRIDWHAGLPQLSITNEVNSFLAVIGRRSRIEVQVLLLGHPKDRVVLAAYITQEQRTSRHAVWVAYEDVDSSVQDAKETFPGLEVLGIGHLHCDDIGAFSSWTDERNLKTLAPLFALDLMEPVTSRSPVVWRSGWARLDPFGRKRLTAGAGEPDGMEYVEQHMVATVFSLTFSPGKVTSSVWGRSEPVEDEPKLELDAQALHMHHCCDTDCSARRITLVDDVPVVLVEEPAGYHFSWTAEQVADELRQRVRKTRFFQVGSGRVLSGEYAAGQAAASPAGLAGDVPGSAEKEGVLTGKETRNELVVIIEAALAALVALEEAAGIQEGVQ